MSEKVLTAVPGKSAPLAASTLHLANVLQSTLELPKLMELFMVETGSIVPYDGLEYVNKDENVHLKLGREERHSSSYKIVLLDKSLGQVTFTGTDKFSKRDSEHLEALLCALIYPLRNALLYKRALDTALRDPVTGINNRAALDSTLDREVNLAHRHGNALSIIMVDIDCFKQINDSYGHLAGDAVLRSLAQRVTECTRGSDMVFRYGGEEFTVVLSSTGIDGARLLADRIRHAIDRAPIGYDCIEIRITVSLGVATLERGDSASELIEKADQALYDAKAHGRNRVVCYSDGGAAA